MSGVPLDAALPGGVGDGAGPAPVVEQPGGRAMTYRLIEDKTPQRCCARCGLSWGQYLRERKEGYEINACVAYGRPYYAHQWIWWEPETA